VETIRDTYTLDQYIESTVENIVNITVLSHPDRMSRVPVILACGDSATMHA